MRTEPIFVSAGQHQVAAAFVRKLEGPYEDLIRPHDWSFAGGGSGGSGITTLPHLRDVIIKGPYKTTGVSETPSRTKIFTCRPTASAEERPCARDDHRALGAEAYRRPLTPARSIGLMPFYEKGAAKGGFEGGVRHGARGDSREPVLHLPARARSRDAASRAASTASATSTSPRACRSSSGARRRTRSCSRSRSRGELSDATRARAAGASACSPIRAPRRSRRRFAASGCACRTSTRCSRIRTSIPNFDEQLADAMRQRDRAVLQRIWSAKTRACSSCSRADYTFVNERLARHYGIPGRRRRRSSGACTYPDDTRRGLLGQGSVLVQTSLANRTSPVLRGKWVMEVLLGTPPPPPPPDVPGARGDGRSRRTARCSRRASAWRCTARTRRATSCHRFMDPIGLALDNFDVTAQVARRARTAQPLDTRGDVLRRHADHDAGAAVGRAAQAAGAARAELHREPAGLRARPARRVLRPAGHPRHRARRQKPTTTGCPRSSWASSRATRSA